MAWNTIQLLCFFTFLLFGVNCNGNNSDTYITSSRSECFSSKNLFSCVKYKAARFVWSVATGQVQLIKNPLYSEYIVPISDNGADVDFSEYRFESGTKKMKMKCVLYITRDKSNKNRYVIIYGSCVK